MREPPLLQLAKPWHSEPAQTCHETRVFSVMEKRSQSQTSPDKGGTFVYLDCPDWVNVIALVEDQVVMVEQHRHGIDCVTLEIPGGMIDPGESPVAAGARELLEETGYSTTSEPGELLGRVSANPAIMNNWVHTLYVPSVEKLVEATPDGAEEVGLRLVPLAKVPELIRSGIIHHSLVVAAFYHLHHRSV
jgi:ADP-ribose pyrophosphatase